MDLFGYNEIYSRTSDANIVIINMTELAWKGIPNKVGKMISSVYLHNLHGILWFRSEMVFITDRTMITFGE